MSPVLCLWVRSLPLRWALLEFKNLYNHHWILAASLKLRRPHEVSPGSEMPAIPISSACFVASSRSLLSSVGALILTKSRPPRGPVGRGSARVPDIPRRGRMLPRVLCLPRGPRLGNRQLCRVPRFHLAPVRHPARPPSLSKSRTNHGAARRWGRGGLYRGLPDIHLQVRVRPRAEGGPLFPPPWVSPTREERSRFKDGLHDVRPRWHNVSRRKARRAFVRSGPGWISIFPLDFEGGAC